MWSPLQPHEIGEDPHREVAASNGTCGFTVDKALSQAPPMAYISRVCPLLVRAGRCQVAEAAQQAHGRHKSQTCPKDLAPCPGILGIRFRVHRVAETPEV
jgi:hypothetical protein